MRDTANGNRYKSKTSAATSAATCFRMPYGIILIRNINKVMDKSVGVFFPHEPLEMASKLSRLRVSYNINAFIHLATTVNLNHDE